MLLRATWALLAIGASSAAAVASQSFDTMFAAAGNVASLAGKRAMITGASSGIGKATACALATEGCNLILVARRGDKLRELQAEVQRRLPDVSVQVLQGDVTDDAFYETLQQSGCLDDIDFLINNAGGAFGKDTILEASVADWRGMLDANCLAAFRVVHAVLPGMVRRERGHIISTGSIAGLENYEGGSVYCAAKHALHAFHEALRYETFDKGVRCTVIAPGNVGEGTEFSAVRFKGDDAKVAGVYSGYKELTAVDIAANIVWACKQPEHVNLQLMHVMPTAQGGATRIHRG